MAPPVVVVGAGGRTGAECVAALEAAGTPVRAVVRDPAKHAGSLGSRQGVELVAGDVGDVPSLRSALKGGGGVIFAASGSGFWLAKAVDCEVRWPPAVPACRLASRTWPEAGRAPTNASPCIPQPLHARGKRCRSASSSCVPGWL